MTTGIILDLLALAALVWLTRATLRKSRERRERKRARLTQTSDGTLHCTRCGGSQFEAHRGLGVKLSLGLLSLLTPPTRVRCVTCGADYARGAVQHAAG